MDEKSHGSETGARVRLPPPLVFLIATLAGLTLQHYAPAIAIHAGGVMRTCGIVILLIGFTIGGSARWLMKKTGQNPAPWKPSPSLILQGPYRFTRNPMYLGLFLVQMGLGMALANLWITLLAPMALLIVHITAVLPEEAYLTQKFGNSYQDFQTRVGRYVTIGQKKRDLTATE